MVTLNKIYTKTGDKGITRLGDMSKRAKYDLRVECYGTVDEANAIIGIARCHTEKPIGDLLLCIQNDLFDLGADLCVPMDAKQKRSTPPLRIQARQVQELEEAIDKLNVSLPELKSFILPGGNPLGAHLHHARTVVRRAERLVVELADSEKINNENIKYLNRLSDLLFVIARHANKRNNDEILWSPGGGQ